MAEVHYLRRNRKPALLRLVAERSLPTLFIADSKQLRLIHPVVTINAALDLQLLIDFSDFGCTPSGDLVESAHTQ